MSTSLTRKGLVAASDKVILSARPALEIVRLFTTDFSVDSAEKGNVISVKVLNATAKDFTRGTYDFAHATNGIDYADIRLSQHKISGYSLNDLDELDDELAPVYAQFAPSCGRAIGKAMIQSLMGLFSYSTRTDVKTVATGSLADFTAFRSQVEAANLDPEDCVLLLEPATYDKLIALLPNSVVGEGGVVNAGIIGQRLGFKAILNAPNASKLSAEGVSKGIGFAVPTNAVGIAGRYVAPIKGQGGDLLEAGYTLDEETGLVFGTRVVQDPGVGDVIWSTNALFGTALMKQTLSVDGKNVLNSAPGFIQLVTA